MALFNFLFGDKKAQRRGQITDKVKYNAKNQIERRIVNNPLNSPFFVYLRLYLIYPILKLPLLPVSDILHFWTKLRLFASAEVVLQNVDLSTKLVFKVKPKENMSLLEMLTYARRQLRTILWKPIGHPLLVEHHFCKRLIAMTSILWGAFALLHVMAYHSVFISGFGIFFSDLGNFLQSLDFSMMFQEGVSDGFRFFLASVVAWIMSTISAISLSTRGWVKASDKMAAFLMSQGAFGKDPDAKYSVLAIPDLIFVSSPFLDLAVVRSKLTKNGWPDNFMPGDMYEDVRSSNNIVITKRPDMEPLLFGGQHARTDILTLINEYDKRFIEPMRAALPRHGEQLFLGEVIDPLWWRSSAIFVNIAVNAHVVCTGQSGSGKTKGMLSFIYAQKRAYPDTRFEIIDGKSGQDFDLLAKYICQYPVAKLDDSGVDILIQVANVIETFHAEFVQRQAQFAGSGASTIFEYRKLVGPMPHCWLIIDEFSLVLPELDYDKNYNTPGTLAHKLRTITLAGRSYGMHLFMASQRYQTTDLHSTLRTNLTTRLIFRVQKRDADFLGIEGAKSLRNGQAYASADGLSCDTTGQDIVKVKLPYIGDIPDELFKKTLTPIDPSLKKQFDYQLVYNKGGDDFADMSENAFVARIHRFFRNQNYATIDVEKGPSSVKIYMEIVKGRKKEVKYEDGTTSIEIEPSSDVKIGVSIIKSDEFDESDLISLQAKFGHYPAIIVFILGKNLPSQRYEFVKKLNEKAPRILVYPLKEYKSDMEYVEEKRRKKTTVDILRPKLGRLGVMAMANDDKAVAWEDLSSKAPLKLCITKIFTEVGLEIEKEEFDSIRGVPFVSTRLPGGTKLYVLIAPDKMLKDAAIEVATAKTNEKAAVVIVTDERLAQNESRLVSDKRMQVWRSAQIDEWLAQGKAGRLSASFVQLLCKSLKIIKLDDIEQDQDALNAVSYGPHARLLVSCTLSSQGDRLERLTITCDITKYTLLSCEDIAIERYRLDELEIPDSATIIVTDGMAPLGAQPKNVQIKLEKTGRTAVFPKTSKWDVESGIMTRRKSKIDADDPDLEAMRRD